MAETETAEAKVDALRDELRSQVDELRQEVRELRQVVERAPHPGFTRRTREERLAGVERLRAFHARILRRRGGEPLPPSADAIAKMREERAAQVLGE